jgi:hypothetical protein
MLFWFTGFKGEKMNKYMAYLWGVFLKQVAVCGVLTLIAGHALSHNPATTKRSVPLSEQTQRAIVFPDTARYKTLVIDLHTHSVFSDGHVWPNIRVAEAQKDGLDGLAITEHLEWQPHRQDILHLDRNRAFEVALDVATGSDLLVIRGSEITRTMPVGHINAVFITDANELLFPGHAEFAKDDPQTFRSSAIEWPAQKALDAAFKQGAFLFWNHPYWLRQSSTGKAKLTDFHIANIKTNKLHGIEIANGKNYSEEAFQIALDHDLTLIGTSDVHNLIDWDYDLDQGGHRPVTLVFASDRSTEGVRNALFAGRTVVWFGNQLLGREEFIHPLLRASLSVGQLEYLKGTQVAEITFINVSDVNFHLRYEGEYTFMWSANRITVPANSSLTVQVKPGERLDPLTLSFSIENALTAPNTHARMVFDVRADSQ